MSKQNTTKSNEWKKLDDFWNCRYFYFEKFDEGILNIETITPKIKCNTGEIFKVFREKFYKQISNEDANKLLKMKSTEILNNSDIKEANDLFEPAISVYSELKEYAKEGWYFSGSGSSFFKVNDGK